MWVVIVVAKTDHGVRIHETRVRSKKAAEALKFQLTTLYNIVGIAEDK